MRCPNIAMTALTALSLSATAVQAGEVFNPAASSQQVAQPEPAIVTADSANVVS
ncbi:hypothetical protein [Leptodesmis sp.]|uniref:hypothetical protein n=1 Tax=Leptodesmis sp. TaxID=3100501 RepID=UPI0040535173